MSNNKDVF